MLLRLLICSLLVHVAAKECPHMVPDALVLWSEWSEKPTAPNTPVVIAAGQRVLLDEQPPRMESVTVYGELIIDPSLATLDLEADFILVSGEEAHFWAGSPDCPLTGDITITLFGDAQPDVSPSGAGTKSLGAVENAWIDIHGVTRFSAWTNLEATAAAGATEITVAEDVEWQAGDEIVIATTDFQDDLGEEFQTERRTISSVAGRVVRFSEPLRYMHWGEKWQQDGEEVDMRAEVALLTRNVKFRGDPASVDSQWGAHIMMVATGHARIGGVEIYRAGQKGELGRYPIHFHVANDQAGSWVKDCAIHDTFQRCITVHGSSNLLIKNNVGYRSLGHCFFIEDGDEEGNIYDHNLAIDPLVHDSLLLSDVEPAGFWITNPKNHFYSNVAVGGAMGFWYAMPEIPLGQATSTKLLRYAPMGDFHMNKAHSTQNGVFVDRGQGNDEGDVSELSDYTPRDFDAHLAFLSEGPSFLTTISEYERSVFGKVHTALFKETTVYKCSQFGIWGRGTDLQVVNAHIADCSVGANFPHANNVFQDSVVVGETDNVGTPGCLADGCYQWWPDEEGRARPLRWWLDRPIVGYQSYDAGGGDIVVNVKFFNFNDHTFSSSEFTRTRKASAFSGFTGPNVLRPTNKFFRISYTNVQNKVHFYRWLPYYDEAAMRIMYRDSRVYDDAMAGIVLVDGDGTMLGECGSQVVGSSPHVRQSDGSCTEEPSWNAWRCPAGGHPYASFTLTDDDRTPVTGTSEEIRAEAHLNIVRLTDGAAGNVIPDVRDVSTDPSTYVVTQSGERRYGTNFVHNHDHLIYIGDDTRPMDGFMFAVHSAFEGQTRFAFPYPAGTTFSITRYGTPFTEVSSKDALTYETYWWDDTNNLLWIYMGMDMERFSYAYGFISRDSYLEVHVTATCPAGDCSAPLSYDYGSLASPVPADSLKTDLCEENGAILNGKVSCTEGSASLVLFADDFVGPWSVYGDNCAVSTDYAADASAASLRCDVNSPSFYSGYFSLNKDYPYDPVDMSPYTHLRIKARVGEGQGDKNYFLVRVRYSWDDVPSARSRHLRLESPEHSATGATGEEWNTYYISFDSLGLGPGHANSDFLSIEVGPDMVNPTSLYLDLVALVDATCSIVPDDAFPASPPVPELTNPYLGFVPDPAPVCCLPGETPTSTTGGTTAYTGVAAPTTTSSSAAGTADGTTGGTDGGDATTGGQVTDSQASAAGTLRPLFAFVCAAAAFVGVTLS